MNSISVRLFALAMCASLLLFNCGCEDSGSDAGNDAAGLSGGAHLTIDQFNLIQNGMTYNDVVAIIGREADATLVDTMYTNYTWHHRHSDQGYEMIDVYFNPKGQVMDKTWLKF